jgi:hypothetical protein
MIQCIGVIPEPVRVVRLITSVQTRSDGTSTSTETVTFWDTEGNATTVSRGLAVADPYVVGWQEKELSMFPTDYASSLAQKAGLQWASSTPAPASTSSLPQETSLAPSSLPPPPSTGDLGIAN